MLACSPPMSPHSGAGPDVAGEQGAVTAHHQPPLDIIHMLRKLIFAGKHARYRVGCRSLQDIGRFGECLAITVYAEPALLKASVIM